jgi:transcriptional regulator with XRE-family HTH domain
MADKEHIEAIGLRIKEALRAKRLKQVDLAKHLGIGKEAVTHLVTGANDPSAHLFKIAELVEVDPYYLWCGKNWEHMK